MSSCPHVIWSFGQHFNMSSIMSPHKNFQTIRIVGAIKWPLENLIHFARIDPFLGTWDPFLRLTNRWGFPQSCPLDIVH